MLKAGVYGLFMSIINDLTFRSRIYFADIVYQHKQTMNFSINKREVILIAVVNVLVLFSR